MPKERSLNLFHVLNKLSVKDRQYYESLSEDEKKEFLPVVIMRWLSGTRDRQQVYLLNEVVNPFIFELFKHKDLLAQLLVVSTSGRSQRYAWLKPKAKKSPRTLILSIIEEFYGYRSSQAQDALLLLDETDILDMAERLGKQPEEITKLKKELKALKDERSKDGGAAQEV